MDRLRRPPAAGTVAWLAAWAFLAPLFACGEETAPPPLPPRPVKMLEVGSEGRATLEFPGSIRAAQQSEMAFEVPGKVTALLVQEADRVERGQVLARLDPRDYQAELDKKQAAAAKAKADYDRYKILFEKGVSPQAELERYQRLYEATQANLRQAQKAVEDAELVAPFAGVVARKLVDDYANVQAKQPVLLLQDDSSLEIQVSIPERDFANMPPGLTLEERTARARPRVTVSSLPGRSFPARVKEFSTSADPATRTYQATFAFENPEDVNVLPGMTAKVTVSVGGRAGALGVPASAVVAPEGDTPYVWIVDTRAMTVHKKAVELGELSGSWIQVRGGLEPGQTIAVSGVNHLRDGMTVRRFER
jgi:RND family efflux transporter MFP subunit